MERHVITIDIGTTAVKGVLMTDSLKIEAAYSVEITTLRTAGRIEQSPAQWYDAFKIVCNKLLVESGCGPKDIAAICFSGQMQDVICVDEHRKAVGNAILYSDFRATEEAREIRERIPDLQRITGNGLDGSIPAAKLLWLAGNDRETLRRTWRILFSAKDFLISSLCGDAYTDMTTAATAGLMDIHAKTWNGRLVDCCGIDPTIMPELASGDTLAGELTEQAAKETGLKQGTKIFVGTGDAGATTLASGICKPGELNINLGTTGWVAAISDRISTSPGVFNLVAMDGERYINVVPFLNAGNIHRWLCDVLGRNGDGYEYIETLLMGDTTPTREGLLCLPYFSGERFPVADDKIRGSFIGIDTETTASDLAKATLEGVAYALRQGLGQLALVPSEISLIGGGAKSMAWRSILTNVLGHPVTVFDDGTYLPAMATASAYLLHEGICDSYESFVSMMQETVGRTVMEPTGSAIQTYERRFSSYVRLYPCLKTLYRN